MSDDKNWLKQFFNDYNTDNSKFDNQGGICSCKNYKYGDLSNLNRNYIEKFYKIGSKSIKCNHNCVEHENRDENISLCKRSPSLLNSVNNKSDDCLSNSLIIQNTDDSTRDQNEDVSLKSNLNHLSILSLIIIGFYLIFIQIPSDFLFVILIIVFIFISSQIFFKYKCFFIQTLNMIKICYFRDNFYLFYVAFTLFSLIIVKILLSLFLYFFSLFYFIIPKSRYFYLSNLLGHLISFDYPELIEYHEKYYFCYEDYRESC